MILTKFVIEVPAHDLLPCVEIKFINSVTQQILLSKIVEEFHIVLESDAH